MGDNSVMKVAVLSGDGIGPEVMDATISVLNVAAKKFDKKFEYTQALIGGVAYDKTGSVLPNETLKICEESDAILFGSVGGPKWESLPPAEQPERGALLPLRRHFKLYANIRAIKVPSSLIGICPLKNELVPNGIDMVFFRELTGGIYFGQPKEIAADGQSAVDTMRYTVQEIERIAHDAFKAARNRSKKVTSVDKANVLMTSVLWRRVVTEIHEKMYSDVKLEHLYVDNAAMQLVKNPSAYDVILTENMFGDILSDAAAMLAGSLGMLPSASINEEGFGLYEPIGGSAPDIAGKGIANPIAQLLSATMMLRFSFGLHDMAQSIEDAVDKALANGYRTGDIYQKGAGEKLVGTKELTDAIISYL